MVNQGDDELISVESGRTQVALIWARSMSGVIGRNGQIPWHLPEDLARFKALTSGHPVVMGRATWESLPARFRPLPGRANLVLSRRPDWTASGALAVHSPAEALAQAQISGLPEPLWVIGGGQIYRLFEPIASRAEVTVVDLATAGDTAAPRLARPGRPWRLAGREPASGWLTSASSMRYRFETWLQEISPS
ncbi:MAG: dihydrofolate reductase [Bifidobacteriaceae bacterium]|jgi:dihydrofolate reductase|nr:dihydrofolate reductase [Bifidobacteriaceae bacterium]